MRKGKHVIGQSVFDFAAGRRIETVKDLLINESNDAVVALLVDEGGLLSSSKVVPLSATKSFGRDAVVIEEASAVVSASDIPEVKAILNRDETLLDKRVLTDTGDLMGKISDMYFDEHSGRILGFEVSGGMLGDIARGTSHLPVDQIERAGPDVIFVRPETGEDLEGQVGGVQGALGQAGTKLSEAVDKAQANIQEQIDRGEPEQALVGKRSGTDVTDENGRIIVANGQRIQAEHVEWAQATGSIQLLSRAAATGETRDFGRRAGASIEEAGDNLGAMWDRFTTRVSEMRDEQGRQADEQTTRMRLVRIADAIGRPVGKVILDRNDNVILDFGDIITHQAVQQAHETGMLDTLLGSVYQAEFGLPLDQLRAAQPASATIEKADGGARVLDDMEQEIQQRDQEKAEREQRGRSESEAAAKQRERERDERARARQDAEREHREHREHDEAAADGGARTAVSEGEAREVSSPR